MSKSASKVLICSHVYPPTRGGIAAFTQDIVSLLNRHGCEIYTLIGLQNNNNLSMCVFIRRLLPIRLYAWLCYLVDAWRMLVALLKFKPKIVICSTWLPFGVFAVFYRRFFGFRLIIQVHGTEVSGVYEHGCRKIVVGRILGAADLLWPNSNYTANKLRKSFGLQAQKLKVVRPFICNAKQVLASRINTNRSYPPVIITAANLYPRKGIDLVLAALQKLKDLSWQYVVAGEAVEPWTQQYYERIAYDLGIGDRVIFLGKIQREALYDLMSKAFMFVMPSRALPDDVESFGIVYIEAQLFGLPCIGTRFGGIPEAIVDGETGILVENEDIDGLSESIRWLLLNPSQANNIGQRGRDRVLRDFTGEARWLEIKELF